MRSPAPRRLVGAISALLVAGGLAAAPTATAVEDFTLTRVAGDDRYETAAAVAEQAFPAGSDVAIVASGERFPDALAGSYLAGRFGSGAPILLTAPDELPAATAEALDALEATTIYVLGGTGAVSDAVKTALEEGDRTVERIAGDDRYDTAAAIATFAADGAAEPGQVGGANTVIVASGEGFADALAVGPLAFQGNLPIVLTPPGALDAAARTAIEELEATRAWIVGGTAAVGAAVQSELEDMDLTVLRIAGGNRYATAVAAAGRGRADLGLTTSAVDLASGERFPDALAAGPASGAANRPLLLTAAAELSDETEDYLVENAATLTSGRVFGGTAAVSNLAVTQANEAGSSGSAEPGVARIVAKRTADNEYDLVRENTDDVVTVTYEDTDSFTVDGQPASVGAFETALTNGDIIEVDETDNDPDDHDLTNVAATSFTNGVVGNVDLADDQLDIIEPASGAIFRGNIAYGAATTFRVDGVAQSLAEFEADLNEGDRIEIAGAAFSLTNRTVTGPAERVEVVEAPIPVVTTNETRFAIGALGDDPDASSDTGQTPDEADSGNDDRYVASGESETLRIDGAEVTYEEFEAALNNGDVVTYSRQDGIETISIGNTDELIEGEVTGDISKDGADEDLTDETNDGGSFTMTDATDDEIAVAYTPTTRLEIDGLVVTEAEFESAISVGDGVTIQRDGTTVEAIELDDGA